MGRAQTANTPAWPDTVYVSLDGSAPRLRSKRTPLIGYLSRDFESGPSRIMPPPGSLSSPVLNADDFHRTRADTVGPRDDGQKDRISVAQSRAETESA
jgi:hypothetical protein